MRLVALLICLILSISGCSGSIKEDTPKSGESGQTAPYTEEQRNSIEPHDLFTRVVSEEMPRLDASTLPVLADRICSALPTLGVQSVMQTALESGFDEYEAGYLLGAATGTVCPEHVGIVKDELGYVEDSVL